MNSTIDYNEKGYSRALYFAFTLKGVYHPDMYIAEKLEMDDEEEDFVPTSEVRATRKPTDRSIRRKATRRAEKHLREIEPYTMSVRITRNGGIIRKGDTYSWLQE